MRAVGAIQEEDGNQEERGETQQREDQRWVLEALVVDLHGDDHDYETRYCPDQLLDEEFVGGAKALFGHDRRGGEDHDQADEDQKSGDGEHPAIDTYALGHWELFHHGGGRARSSLGRGFAGGDNFRGSCGDCESFLELSRGRRRSFDKFRTGALNSRRGAGAARAALMRVSAGFCTVWSGTSVTFAFSGGTLPS